MQDYIFNTWNYQCFTVQLIISQIVLCSRPLIWYPPLPNCWHASAVQSAPNLQGAHDCTGYPAPPSTFGCCSFWFTFIWLGVWRVWANALGSSAAACPGVGGFDREPWREPRASLKGEQQTFCRPTQEQGDIWAAICCAQLPRPGEAWPLAPRVAGGRKSRMCSPAHLRGWWGWRGGRPGGQWWQRGAFVHHRAGAEICPAASFAHS